MPTLMAAPPEDGLQLDDSEEEIKSEPSTPDTSVSVTVPLKKAKKSRDKYLPCPYEGCDKSFNRPARLEEHKRSHTNERIFKCPEPGCTKDFLRNTHLKRHVEANHQTGPKSYVCRYEDCDQSFVTNQRLQRHHEVHEKRDKYRCTEPGCDQTFRKHNTRDLHIRTVHRGEAAFPCDEMLEDGTPCPKQFTNVYGLTLHKGQHHGVKHFFCTICTGGPDSAFGTFSKLQSHNKTVHPPTCDVCGFVGKSAKNLAHHVERKHSGDTLSSRQTHICPHPQCNGQGFISKRNLQVHITTIHEDNRAFKCGDTSLSLNHVEGWDVSTACGRAFHVKATLENHIRVRHMGLESAMKSALKRKAERLSKSAGQDARITKRRKAGASKLDLLTGTSMVGDIRRTIPCSIQGCDFTFVREWDRQVHLQSRHGILMEDNWIMSSSVQQDDRNYDAYDDDDYEADKGRHHHDWNPAEEYDDEEESHLPVAQLLGTRSISHYGFEHGMTEEELEESARHGGQFWIGGVNENQNTEPFDLLDDEYGLFVPGGEMEG